jgi:hypothetical protein
VILDIRVLVHEEGIGGHGNAPDHIRKVTTVMISGAGGNRQRRRAFVDLADLIGSGTAEIVRVQPARPLAGGRDAAQPDQIRAWKKQYERDGWSIQKIADQAGRAYSTVHRHLTNAKTKFREPGHPRGKKTKP